MEGCAFVAALREGEASVVLLDEFLRDGKPEPAAADLATGSEGFEERLFGFCREPRSVVFDIDVRVPFVAREGDAQVLRLRLDGVLSQVSQGAVEVVGVALDGQGRREMRCHFRNAFGVELQV